MLPDAGLDHLFWVDSRLWVNGLSHNVHVVFGHDGRSVVNWLAGSVKDPPEHILGNRSFHDLSGELASRVLCVDPRRSFEHLNNRLVP